MKIDEKSAFDPLLNHAGCFGEYNDRDMICNELCAVSLRCIIEQDKSVKMEILDELLAYNDLFITVQ